MFRDDTPEESGPSQHQRDEDQNWIEVEILERPIRSLPSLRTPVQVESHATLDQVIERMNRDRVGCVLIVQDGCLIGVFTERDVLTKIAAEAVDTSEARVGDFMTADPETLTLDDGIAYALNKMTVGGFRHIPLVDEHNRPVGIAAMRHIVEYLVDLFPRAVLNLPPSPNLAISRTREGA